MGDRTRQADRHLNGGTHLPRPGGTPLSPFWPVGSHPGGRQGSLEPPGVEPERNKPPHPQVVGTQENCPVGVTRRLKSRLLLG